MREPPLRRSSSRPRTGEETSGREVGAAGPGELLNLGGTDRDEVFDKATADIPFPPGYEAQRAWALSFYPRETDSAVTESRLRAMVAGYAVCTWADAWVAADDAGDAAARTTATTTLAAAMAWEDIRTSDIPDAAPIQGTDQRRSYWGWLPPLAEAAQAGGPPGGARRGGGQLFLLVPRAAGHRRGPRLPVRGPPVSDEQAEFEVLFVDTRAPLLAYLTRRPPAEDATDLLAEVYLVAWRRRTDLPPGDERRLWLFGVARRVLAEHYRSTGVRADAEGAAGGAGGPEARDDDGRGEAVRSALASLSDLDRELVTGRGPGTGRR